MARPLRSAHSSDPAKVREALDAMRYAARLLAEADCPQALNRCRAAVKSADGALRHSKRRVMNQYSEGYWQ